ncbi:NACHT domain-containing protein [Nitrogeniibacter aestuarii]|uniref:NACHT domain-containing protein n=1 Tax=Nitrogeniibacter aestuarii TaxID=2815343 RepID=UPI001E2BA71F|nr:hypothetical protein [Nitrogeniibacter aestuarii]
MLKPQFKIKNIKFFPRKYFNTLQQCHFSTKKKPAQKASNRMLTEIIPLDLGDKWLKSLWAHIGRIRKKRHSELNSINNVILFSDPLELAEVYVEPCCQEVNPADRHDEDFFISKQPLFRKIEEFLKAKSFQQGNNQLFILSDAGMGKTSSLVMIKLLHLSPFWPKGYSCHLEKLGEDTINRISAIENRRKTLLLLDSLDEDITAYGRTHERLLEILEATKTFSKVIITCRTQFFPEHESDPLEALGRIKIGPFVCPSKYLSVFDDYQVDRYLENRFPKSFIYDKNKARRSKAKQIVSRMGSLRCRPMLLSFIGELVEADEKLKVWSEYSLYYSLVKNWLIREEAKTGIKSETLFLVCARLAFEMQAKKKVKISPPELDELTESFGEIEKLTRLDITGRSLLNRNSDGDYRFSHYSIQEFLVVHFILEVASIDENRKIYPTDFIKQLLEANTEKVNLRLKEELFSYENHIEPNGQRATTETSREFMDEKEILSLLSEFSDQLNEIDISAFGSDMDIPAYLRRILIKHSKRSEGTSYRPTNRTIANSYKQSTRARRTL